MNNLILPKDAEKKLVTPKHHSTTDWDFGGSGNPYYADFTLSSNRYVSASTCLCTTPHTYPQAATGWFFLKSPTNIRDGKMSVWMNYPSTFGGWVAPKLIFNAQAESANNGELPANCFFVDPANNLVRKRVAGSNTDIASFSPAFSMTTDVWYRLQVQWYSWRFSVSETRAHITVSNTTSTPIVMAEFDYDNTTFYASSTNLVGISQSTYDYEVFYYDDVEVYIRNPMPSV